jgi:hypothetical protein
MGRVIVSKAVAVAVVKMATRLIDLGLILAPDLRMAFHSAIGTGNAGIYKL